MTTLMTIDSSLLHAVTGGQRTDATPTPTPAPPPCFAACSTTNNSHNTTINGNFNNNGSGNEVKFPMIPGVE